jgi:hypothetical protein
MAIQQLAYTTGKNATDSTMIIDGMDLLYTRRLDGFCLVTSNSDFKGLAVRLREEGLLVYGFGEQNTPEAFRNACHKFIFTEVLRPASTKLHQWTHLHMSIISTRSNRKDPRHHLRFQPTFLWKHSLSHWMRVDGQIWERLESTCKRFSQILIPVYMASRSFLI